MPCIPLHQTWQIYPPSIEHRCLAYHYTKHGRSTGRSHIWQIYPHSVEHRCLAYHYTKHGRSTGRSHIWQIYPHSVEHRCLAYHYTKHGRSTGRSTPSQSSIDALHTTTPNFVDYPPSEHVDVILIWEIWNVISYKKYADSAVQAQYLFSIFTISTYPLSLMQLTVWLQLKHSFVIVIIFRCCNFATNSLHAVKMLIWYCHHFLLSSICNWPSSGVCVVYNIPSVGVKGTSSVLWSSANFCSISQNMH